ncbi:hypothetical protein AB4059_13430 [Lysobacter sp. 2RAF19]
MKEWTGVEVLEERRRLERDAATLLGMMIFEYSRLEMDLGLFLAWSDDGVSLDQLTKQLEPLTFSKRIDFLEKTVAAKFQESPETLALYANWVADAQSVRGLRNDLFHGRWGVETINQQVVNVVGLPTSPDQKRTPYSITDLQAALDQMRDVRARLQKLRSSFPV